MLLGAVEGGGTWFRAAVGHADGTIQDSTRMATTAPMQTLGAVADFLAAHPITAVGIGCFGPLSLSTTSADYGKITTTPKAGWSGVDVRGFLAQRLKVPVAIQTDVTAAAIGEHWLGAGQGAESLAYLTIGTGIGGGFLVKGQPVTGRLHPEMGHLPARRQPDDAFPGLCPFHGDCLEGMVSGPALAARWGVPGEQLPAGHPAWDLSARLLADGLTTMLAVIAPDRLILGGGVGQNPALWGPLHTHLAVAVSSYWPRLCITDWLLRPDLGEQSALLGALLMARGARRGME
ncbi:MAG: ROK family protein [Myxococcota bacterium]|nr:ROK family protein [Myxococcota bacterium]